MKHCAVSTPEHELEQLTDQFAQWRAGKQSRAERIPPALWHRALTLCETLPVTRVTRTLRLSPTDLRRQRARIKAPLPSREPDRSIFAEVHVEDMDAGNSARIDITRTDGARLHIELPVGASLGEIVRGFVGN